VQVKDHVFNFPCLSFCLFLQDELLQLWAWLLLVTVSAHRKNSSNRPVYIIFLLIASRWVNTKYSYLMIFW